MIKTKIPQENISNSMTITSKAVKRLWRPNNYRRQIKVKTKSNSTLQEMKGAIGMFPVENSHNKIITIKNYKGVTLQYAKFTLTAIYSQNIIDGEKEVFVVEGSSVDVVESWIMEKKQGIQDIIDVALFDFINRFNLLIPFEKPIWSRHEDWTSDEEIKKIPDWTIIHGDHLKKVYPEGVEYVGGKGSEPTHQLINRVKNDGLRNISPLLVDELKEIRSFVEYNHPFEFLTRNVKCVDDVFKFKEYVFRLTSFEKQIFSEWTFEKFGSFF